MTCGVNPGPPTLTRAEGLAERVSDIQITCTGGQAGATYTGSLFLFLGDLYTPPLYGLNPDGTTVAITGRLSPGSDYSEAMLLVGDVSTNPVVGGNVFQGVQPGTNMVVFDNLTLTAPGVDHTLTLRIANLRVDVKDFTGAAIQLEIFPSTTPIIGVSDSTAPLAIKAPGVLFALQTAAGAPALSLSLPSTPGGALTHRLQFTEGFAQSFRKRNTGTSVATPTVLADQAVPGTDYHTESGFYDSLLPSTNSLNQAGLASQGTRLVARFSNVPAGVNLYVTTRALPNTGATSAVLVAADGTGAGAYAAVAQTGTADAGGTTVGIAPVTISNGSGTATWEILDADPDALESYTFGLMLDGPGATGSATVVGGLGPISAVTVADATSPVPRFADTAAQAAACAASPCLTASPAAISISHQTAAAAPAPFTVQLSSTGAALPFNATAVATQNGWLSVSPSSGTTPTSLQVTINPVNLWPGSTTGSIVVTSGSQTVTIPVIVNVSTGPSGYLPLGCQVLSEASNLSRTEGLTEQMGDLILTCTGGTPTPAGAAVPTVDLTLVLNAPITNRTYPNGWSDALLLIDEPNTVAQLNGAPTPLLACQDSSGSCSMTGTGNGAGTYNGAAGRPNVFSGKVSGNTLTFPNVPLDPLGSGVASAAFGLTGRILRITNVRVDASGLPPAITGSEYTEVYGTVSAGPIAIPYPTQVRGYAMTGLTFSLRSPDDSAPGTGVTLDQCSASSPQRAGVLRFTENFGAAFKTRSMAPFVDAQTSPAPQAQDIPGLFFIAESGFYAPSLTSPVVDFATVGLTTAATRVRAQLANIPLGARVFVSQQRVEFTGSTPSVPTTGAVARLIGNEMLAFSPAPVTSTIEGIAATELTVTNGTASAIWEVLREDPNAMESLDFLFWVQGGATSVTAATVTGSLAPAPPAFADAGSHAASSTLPVPRFQAGQTAQPAFSVSNCALHFTTGATLPAGTTWASYSTTLAAAGGTPAYLFNVTSGALPTGLYLDPGGKLFGIPQGVTGDFSFTVTVTDQAQAYDVRTFSLHLDSAPDPGPPTADWVIPSSGTGYSQTFMFQFTDPGGADDIAKMRVWFASDETYGAAHSCQISMTMVSIGYTHALNIELLGDNGSPTGVIGTLGGGVLQNSQCLVDLPASGGFGGPLTQTVTLTVHFLPAFAGAKNLYVAVDSKRNITTSAQRGTWTVDGSVIASLLSPPLPAAGTRQIFRAQYTFASGLNDIASLGLWVTNWPGPRLNNTCMVEFAWQSTNKFVLHGDDINTSIPLDYNTGLVQNSQCIVDTSGLSLTPSGANGAIITVPLSFKSTFQGPWNVYLLGLSKSNPRGWEVQGSFTVPFPISFTLAASRTRRNWGRR
jgi:hypothetical protein